MITREADYAIRTVVHLAGLEEGASVSCSEVARWADVPYRFLRKIVSKLVTSGIVKSRRGRRGGLVLERPAGEISLLDVIRAVDPRGVTLNTCLGEFDACSRQKVCRTHTRLAQVQQLIDGRLSDITVDKLVHNGG